MFHNIILGDHASWNNVIFVVLNIFSFVFFQKGFSYFFVDTKLVCIHVYHIQREREREREREIGMIILLYDLSNTTCDFFIVINILGMFIVVVVSTTQLKCSYNTSLLEETCNESESRKWKVVNNEGFCVYIRVCHKKSLSSLFSGDKKEEENQSRVTLFFCLFVCTQKYYMYMFLIVDTGFVICCLKSNNLSLRIWLFVCFIILCRKWKWKMAIKL